jgi:uncharacterized membrane protein YeiH
VNSALVLALDLAGTFVFALSGAMAGVKHRLDLFGVLVLAFAAANTGGITRDVLIGAVPPGAISDWRYIVVSLLAGLMTFRWHPLISRLRSPVLVFDAAGLALFAVSGAQKALAYQLNPVAAVLMGMLTGIGGGMLRDVLVNEVPTVLRAVHRDSAGRRSALLRPPLHGDPARVAASRRRPAEAIDDGKACPDRLAPSFHAPQHICRCKIGARMPPAPGIRR